MKNELLIHIWEISGIELIVAMDKNFMLALRKKAIKLGYSRLARKIEINEDWLRHIFYQSSTRLTTMLKIAKELNVNLEKLERNIVKLGGRKRKYDVRFPLKLTPLHLRVVAHLIGDGTYSSSQWNQLKEYESYMLGLLSQICVNVKPCHYSHPRRVNTYTNIHIPRFLIKMWEAKLGCKIDTPEFIKNISNFPLAYRVELLLALLVDEGSIPKRPTNIFFAMRDYEISKAVFELCRSLKYKVNFKEYFSEGKPFYMISFPVEAILALEKDVKNIEEKYGKFAGLWYKTNDLKRRCSFIHLKNR